ncbi:MAG: efflux RND transporter periplasmic adaptor subunit [Candidatus Cohnella colombiensis]|uniref:Efflux RND transporter periplasmic adaptor subunit n=1 Tax=Candidatus Cohnella colombiensis TaxID=3121368 RepID=A0AA95EY63_9BACL|nr:MAG: efflux RND transporter periplasmic adaptor subunit [Cohnella sp.]
MSRTLKQIAALSLSILLAGTLTGCSLLPKEEESLKPPLVKPAQENYTTTEVVKGTIQKTVNGTATFESIHTEVVQFTGQGGRIDKILVKSGGKVKKGDVLVQLLFDGLDLQLKEQQLALERAKLNFQQNKFGEEQALKIAALLLEIEQIKYDRLLENYNSKQLKAGMDGTVTFVESAKEGDYIDAYQTLVIIADTTQLQLALRVANAADLYEVEFGVAVDINYNSKKYVGTVVQTPSSSPETQNKELADKYSKTVYITIDTLPEDAVIGKLAAVKIITKQRDDILFIPKSGLRSYLGRNFVRVMEEGNKLREIDVEPGLTTPTEVEIISGVEEGQVIVLQ